MEIVNRLVDELKEYENNPRKNDDAVKYVTESIKQFGFKVPIVVDKDDVIVCGHTRLKAAKKLKMKTVPCVVADDLTEDQIKAFRLADNKTAEFSKWDLNLLTVELSEIKMDMVELGFETKATDEVPEEEIPEPPKDPITKKGDVWILGDHRLMCGDCTDVDNVDKLFDGNKAQVCITSPPYGDWDIAHLRKKFDGSPMRDGTTFYGDTKSKTGDEWVDLLRGFYSLTRTVTDTQFINIGLIGSNKTFLAKWIAENVDTFVDVMVWNNHTTPPQMAERVLNNAFEFVFIFDNENNSRALRYGDFHGDKSNYIETKHEKNEYRDVHKAVFPIQFVNEILSLNGKADTFYEPFAGTGTTIIACETAGKKCYAMEINPSYCDVIVKRWEALTGNKAVRKNG